MSAIKDGRYPINLRGKEYHLLFSLNALGAVQDKFGGYDKLNKIFSSENKDIFKDTRWLLTLLINEGLEDGEPQLEEMQVGRMIHLGNIDEIKNAIYLAFAKGVNGGEDTEDSTDTEEYNENKEDNEGNSQSVQ